MANASHFPAYTLLSHWLPISTCPWSPHGSTTTKATTTSKQRPRIKQMAPPTSTTLVFFHVFWFRRCHGSVDTKVLYLSDTSLQLVPWNMPWSILQGLLWTVSIRYALLGGCGSTGPRFYPFIVVFHMYWVTYRLMFSDRYVEEVVQGSWGLDVTRIKCPGRMQWPYTLFNCGWISHYVIYLVCLDPIRQSEWSRYVSASLVERYEQFNQPFRPFSRHCPSCRSPVIPCQSPRTKGITRQR